MAGQSPIQLAPDDQRSVSAAVQSLPSDALIILPVRTLVLFPGVVFPISVSRAKSVAAAQEAIRRERQIGILMQRDESVAEPTSIDLHRVGTVANILRYVTAPDGGHHMVCQAANLARLARPLEARQGSVSRTDVGQPDRIIKVVDHADAAARHAAFNPRRPDHRSFAIDVDDVERIRTGGARDPTLQRTPHCAHFGQVSGWLVEQCVERRIAERREFDVPSLLAQVRP